ncbi:MAG: lysophospholipase, partial [Alphaproteobacteria bacterium]|nr:lysophospholipase [Alphaproteobacteria bacterium]
MTERVCLHRTFTTHDGEVLFFRHWPATTADALGAVLLLHRGHEHGGRMAHLVDELDLPGHAFYALDTRGHGLSPGPRGHAPSFAALVKDLDCLVAHLNQDDGVATDDLMIVAQSIGAVIAAGWVHDYAPELRGMVLAAPAFRVRLYVPFARQWLALGRSLFGPFHVTSYVSSSMLTHDVGRAVSYDEDPLVTRPISVDLLLELAAAGDRLVQDAAAITTPTFLLLSGADAVVDSAAQHAFFVNLGSPIRERYVAEGFFHDTLGERDRADVLRRVRGFIQARFGEPVETVSWLDAHRRS